MATIPNQISHIANTSLADADNSTSANISNGGTFTGEWTRVQVGSRLILTAKADQNLTIQVQYSPDGTNDDGTISRYYRTGQFEPPHIFINARPYYRIVVANASGSDTTVCRINSYIAQESGILNIPIDAAMSQDYDSLSVRPTSFSDEVALGRRQGWSLWNKFGYNSDIDTGSAEIIASFGGTFSRMTTSDTLSIVSTSASDDDGGVGLNSIVIYGIDENRDEQIEVIALNGTTSVTTSNQWLGVNRVAAFLFGSSGSNVGTVTLTATTATSIQAEMPAGDGVTQQLIFHVPRNHIFLAEYVFLNINKIAAGGSPTVIVKGLVYSSVNNGTQEIFREVVDTSVTNDVDIKPPSPFPIAESSILYFTATTDTSNTVVSGRFGGKLVRDVDA